MPSHGFLFDVSNRLCDLPTKVKCVNGIGELFDQTHTLKTMVTSQNVQKAIPDFCMFDPICKKANLLKKFIQN